MDQTISICTAKLLNSCTRIVLEQDNLSRSNIKEQQENVEELVYPFLRDT